LIRIVSVDDQEMFRVGLRTVLATQDGIAVVGEARDGAEAVARVLQARPDVVLMDIRMPGMDGLAAIVALRERGVAVKSLASKMSRTLSVSSTKGILRSAQAW
jgi:YesN/AraC family two-component response regulator